MMSLNCSKETCGANWKITVLVWTTKEVVTQTGTLLYLHGAKVDAKYTCVCTVYKVIIDLSFYDYESFIFNHYLCKCKRHNTNQEPE